MKSVSFRNDILPLKEKLYRLALRITLNPAEAEDVVQETMIKVWNRRDNLGDDRQYGDFLSDRLPKPCIGQDAAHGKPDSFLGGGDGTFRQQPSC